MNKKEKPLEKELLEEEYKLGSKYYNKILQKAKEEQIKK